MTESKAAESKLELQPVPSASDIESQADAQKSKGNSENTSNGAEADAGPVMPATYREIIYYFFILGWTAFGGPAAHISMFQKLFVEKIRWCTYYVFAELLMLGQCMPGPTSTQMGFALGVLKKGLSGGVISGILFQGPGFLILSILGWAASEVLDKDYEWLNGIVTGLAAAGIALVASACVALLKNICKGRLLQVIATVAAVVAYYYPKPWTFPALIVLGGITTIILKRKDIIEVKDAHAGVEKLGFKKLGGGILLLTWVVVLIVTLVLAGNISYDESQELHWFSAFYRTGSIIFGGGQVVLPMLYNDVVAADCPDQQYRCCPTTAALDLQAAGTSISNCTDAAAAENDPNCQCSWMSGNEFYAGLALAQAMPGPLFNFAAYLGAVIALNANVSGLVGIVLCWVALFAPGIIIIFGILPYWGAFRKWQIYRRALPGLNSAAVGLIVASVFQLSLSAYDSSPFPTTSISIGIVAFSATEVLNVPAPLVVIAGGALGAIGWAADMK